ncbi:formamidopyrimidine-DNA glycosylase isoform X2 [Benincasa hispida]|uniref:formamidopyrimidine-DNA glycosylase isoform X2 n=1 Tax=Benincasa hispida TaxID=102211 RepID=UPI00190007CE|nr:formamidopyrimidine-DNA glycosylase isoform X2 [Benincasa hispida]
MPELPEVEAARRAIEEHCVGKVIKKAVIADDTKVIDGVSPADFEASLLGKTILSAHRKGKHLWLRLDSPPFPAFHFGMAGAIYIKGVAVTNYKRSMVNDDDEWPSKYSKFFVELEDGVDLSFTDKRRFAKVSLLKDPASVPPISKLGPDALLEPMALDDFIESMGKKKLAIKTLLLDQMKCYIKQEFIRIKVLQPYPKKVVQLCTRAYKRSLKKQLKLMPSPTAFLKNGCFIFDGEKGLDRSMVSSVRHLIILMKQLYLQVIEKALEVGADSSRFPNNWIFHSREKKPGKAFVDGKEIHFITTGGRTSAFVPELQKLTGAELKNQNSKRKGNNSKEMNDEGASELVSKTEKTADTADTKKKQPKPKGRPKKPSTKRKSKSDDVDGSEEEAENDDASDDDDGHCVGKKKVGKTTNNGRMLEAASEPEKSLKQTVLSSQSGRPRKKAK